MEKLINPVKILPEITPPLLNEDIHVKLKQATKKVQKVADVLKQAFTASE